MRQSGENPLKILTKQMLLVQQAHKPEFREGQKGELLPSLNTLHLWLNRLAHYPSIIPHIPNMSSGKSEKYAKIFKKVEMTVTIPPVAEPFPGLTVRRLIHLSYRR